MRRSRSTARSSTSVKSSTERSSSAVRYSASAMANICRTPRASIAFRPRSNARTRRSTSALTRTTSARCRFAGCGRRIVAPRRTAHMRAAARARASGRSFRKCAATRSTSPRTPASSASRTAHRAVRRSSRELREPRMADRAVREERARDRRRSRRAERLEAGEPACAQTSCERQARRTARSRKRSSTSQATSRRSQEVRQAFARARIQPSCASTSATSGSWRRARDEDAQRAVERLVDEPRHLGFVRQRESGIEVRFERKLAQQREAEGVDRADLDVAEPIAQRGPAARVERATGRPRGAVRGRSARASRRRPCA